MRLEVNTNGAWRIVLSGIGVIDDGAQLDRIKAAAAELTRAGAELMRRPPTWRLVSEADGRVVAYCGGERGWEGVIR